MTSKIKNLELVLKCFNSEERKIRPEFFSEPEEIELMLSSDEKFDITRCLVSICDRASIVESLYNSPDRQNVTRIFRKKILLLSDERNKSELQRFIKKITEIFILAYEEIKEADCQELQLAVSLLEQIFALTLLLCEKTGIKSPLSINPYGV
jgi:hypothetical protein